MLTIGLIMALSVVISWSIWMRMCRCRNNPATKEVKASPLSIAVQEIVATAVGIYLSLVMVVAFLILDIPEKMSILDISLDPLAFLAVLLAIIQPLFFNLSK